MYFTKSADNYRIAKILLLILLTLFLILAIVFGNGQMRGVNFRYLVKYLDIGPQNLDARYVDISYAIGGGSAFALYHDDLVVLGEGKLALYDMAGDLRFRETIETGTAAVEAKGKYLAVYVPGKQKLSLFHSFGKAYETSFSLPITQACVSENGMTAVCLKEEHGASIVILDQQFETKTVFSLEDGVIMNAVISENGNKLAVLSLVSKYGTYQTKLELFDLTHKEKIKSEELGAQKPLSAGFFEDGSFYVMLERTLMFYTASGERKNSYTVSESSFQLHCEENSLLLYTTTGDVVLYDSKGTAQAQLDTDLHILDAKADSERILLLSEKEIVIYNQEGELLSRKQIPSGALDFFSLRDNSILVCYASETKRIQ